MAQNTKFAQAATSSIAAEIALAAVFSRFSKLARPLQSIRYPADSAANQLMEAMMFNDLTHKFAALALTIVMSATCVLAAVGPAAHDGSMKTGGNAGAAVATAARFVA
ncbi:hypothetical protein [Sphingomonas mollis]|uniref:Uncharacterized protein n=1 Tax=Sphingomonas mollis TaxID=2795726 RepID=A0ABS0XSX2_9SPHN|nr:hypothetical protein [Sphingomonas sp. BT553]MBJ6123128.1 hypothetical protein [Sphingomonas sp. BT553]